MDTTTLQIPISKTLKSGATEVAREYGFSSLQEVVRVILTKLASRQLTIRIEEPAIKLSKKAAKRYNKIYEDFRAGKSIYTVHSSSL